MKVFLWLIAVVASGAAGFYFGFGYGAKTLGAIASQNEVSRAVATVRITLDALEQNDLTQANKLYEKNLTFALVQIGTSSQELQYLACTGKDRETMQAARKYAEAHPGLLGSPAQRWQVQGLEFCAPKEGERAGGA